MSQPRLHRFSRAGDARDTAASAPLVALPPVEPTPGAPRTDDPGERAAEVRLLALVVQASERMDDAADLEALWTVVAAEAAQILDADARVMQWSGEHWVVRTQHPSPSGDSDVATASVRSGTGVSADEDSSAEAMALPRIGLPEGHARSVLVTDFECSELRTPTRLVWTSPHQDAFRAVGGLAAAYTRIVTGAIRRTHARIRLQRAVMARHRVGQAQGIVMARLELPAADAFELLIRRSQNMNVRLSILADHIIHSQELESAPGEGPPGTSITEPGPGAPDASGSLDEQLTRTATRSLHAVDDPSDHSVVTSELSDALSEAVVIGPGDAAGRAEVMCAVVDEMRAAVEWLNDAGSREELRSLQPTVTAVQEHLRRMLRLTPSETS